ncbi:uncharacterized protein BDZ99DRAFT_499098 [Mytilinidion resinicola]|uniref:Ankyrin n=1 Tax=Mytilinidion resinicola TaxID=574789 RepID=A0A6A6YIJ1_9PEZI|nr:uncharacterized protein BDZ99DRAFT_499098 [Mytilinidion resinicola]KAF2808666.1 hypothetical protein BDZ99DRAFT_499098 [Mytilinidion resinicola]
MQTPAAPSMELGAPFFRPEEVDLCYQAACKGDLEEVKKQVQRLLHDSRPCPEQHTPHPKRLCNSLFIAIQKQNIEMVRFLLDENVADPHIVAEGALLNHGADPNARCAWDFTPMSLAIYQAPLELIDYVFSRGGDACRGQLLQLAVIRKKPDALHVLRRVIQRGAPINEVKYEKEPTVYSEREPFGRGQHFTEPRNLATKTSSSTC